jgi:purine-binding chemotaxis protein CheW
MIQNLDNGNHQVEQQDVILFDISNKIFGLPVDDIKEIIKPLESNKVPLTPPAIEGLIKVREDIYPLVNTERLLNLNHVEPSEENARFILVKYQDTSFALRVNQVESLASYRLTDLTQEEQEEASGELKLYTKGSFTNQDGTSIYLLSLEAITESLLEEARKITS